MGVRSVAFTLLLLACCASGRGTAGKRGVVEFHYTTCRADFDTRCTQQNEPIAAGGAQVYIRPTHAQGCGGSVAFSTAESTDPAVFSAEARDGIVVVTSASPGQADLRLLDAGGNELDRTTLWVEAVSKIAVAVPGATGATLVNGFTQTVHFDRFDTSGAVLMGYGGINYTTPSPVIVNTPPTDPNDDYFYGSPFAFHGSDGSAQIVASAGSASTTFPVAFVDASLITTVVVSPAHSHVVENGHSLTEIDAAGALGDGTTVFGAVCSWQPSAGVSQYSDASLEQFDAKFAEDIALRRSYFEGSGSATCVVGAASQQVAIP